MYSIGGKSIVKIYLPWDPCEEVKGSNTGVLYYSVVAPWPGPIASSTLPFTRTTESEFDLTITLLKLVDLTISL